MPTFSKYQDEILLKRLSNDDQEAFSMIYRHYWERLFVTAVKVLRQKDEAEDVVQDVFLSIWNRRQELNIEGSLAAYLQTSVRYKAIHYIEKNITRHDYLTLLTETAVNSFYHSPEIDLNLKEVQHAIRQTIKTMPPKMQEVYLLSRQSHLTHNQISKKLHISQQTVKKHIQHALQLIKVALNDHSISIVAILVLLIG